MKVAVLIMASNEEPSTSNVEAMRNTFIADTINLMKAGKLRNTYEFFVYSYAIGPSAHDCAVEENDGVKYLYIDGVESIYNTFEKTVFALGKIGDDYQWYVRLNISAFLNIRLLDNALRVFDTSKVYCNAINTYITDETYYNDLYPRGDFLVFSKAVKNGILEHSPKYIRCDVANKNRLTVPHVDDCLIGLCLIDYFGQQYYNHLQMVKYSFLPMHDKLESIAPDNFAIVSRVKTIPPDEKYSGYSWEDNEWRRKDCEKMQILHKYYQNADYSKIAIQSLINNVIDKNNVSRATLAVQLTNATVPQIIAYLKQKRG